MTKITLNDLTATRTLDRDAMARTIGGINWNQPGVYRVRRYCYLVRTRFGLRRYCYYR